MSPASPRFRRGNAEPRIDARAGGDRARPAAPPRRRTAKASQPIGDRPDRPTSPRPCGAGPGRALSSPRQPRPRPPARDGRRRHTVDMDSLTPAATNLASEAPSFRALKERTDAGTLRIVFVLGLSLYLAAGTAWGRHVPRPRHPLQRHPRRHHRLPCMRRTHLYRAREDGPCFSRKHHSTCRAHAMTY